MFLGCFYYFHRGVGQFGKYENEYRFVTSNVPFGAYKKSNFIEDQCVDDDDKLAGTFELEAQTGVEYDYCCCCCKRQEKPKVKRKLETVDEVKTAKETARGKRKIFPLSFFR